MDRRRNADVVMEAMEGRVMLAGVAFIETPVTLQGAALSSDSPVVVGRRILFAANDGNSAMVSIYDTSTGHWSTKRFSHPLGSARATVGAKAIFAGGAYNFLASASDGVDIYDGDTGRWSTSKLSYSANQIAAGVIGEQAIFAGGDRVVPDGPHDDPRDEADVYDDATGQWTAAKLSEARIFISIAAVGHRAILAGGADVALTEPFSQTSSGAVDYYDSDAGTWTAGLLPAAELYNGSAAVGNYGLFTYDNKVDVYSGNGQWSTAQISPRDYHYYTLTAVGDAALVTDGFTEITYQHDPLVHVFDSHTGKWSAIRTPFALGYAGPAVMGSKALFIGYTRSARGEAAAVLDPTTGRWSTCQLAASNSFPVATVGGSVFMEGGRKGLLLTPTSLVPPSRPGPTADSETSQVVPRLSWKGVAGAVSYDVYLDDSPAVRVTGTSWAPRSPIAAGRHRWQVVAHVSGGLLAGPMWRFTVDTLARASVAIQGASFPIPAARPTTGTVQLMLTNTGTTNLRGWDSVSVYASPTGDLGRSAVLLGTSRLGELLAPGESAHVGVSISLPAGMASGEYRLGVTLTAGGQTSFIGQSSDTFGVLHLGGGRIWAWPLA